MESLYIKLVPPLQKEPGNAFTCKALIQMKGKDTTQEVTLRLTGQDYRDISTLPAKGKKVWDLTLVRTIDKNRSTWAIAPMEIKCPT